MSKRRRRYLGPPNLLTREEIKQHFLLLEDIEKQLRRSRVSNTRKFKLRKQLRNLRSELWTHKDTRKVKVTREEKTYKGAES